MASRTNAYRQRANCGSARHGSLSIDLGKAVFFDHENDKGGGVLDLIKLKLSCDTREAIRWLENEGFLPHAGSSNDASAKKRRIVAEYDYHDAVGELRAQVVRYEPKGFAQRRRDGSGWKWDTQGVPSCPIGCPSCWRR